MALLTDFPVSVPCGACTGCCRSSKFIHIGPAEKEALRRIPKKLLVVAPLLSRGNKLLVHTSEGTCPILAGNICSIYEHRPVACCVYDCRIFAAAGVLPDSDEPLIAARATRWRFTYPHRQDHDVHSAVKAAAQFIRDCRELFPGARIPERSSELAVLALKVYTLFSDIDTGSTSELWASTGRELAREIVEANDRFESMRLDCGKKRSTVLGA